MTPSPSPSIASRVLDIVFGKKLEGEEAERALAERPPQWASTVYLVLSGALVFLAFALLAWSSGWIPFIESRIDSIWAGAALGGNVLLGEAWRWIPRRYVRRVKTGLSSKAAFLE